MLKRRCEGENKNWRVLREDNREENMEGVGEQDSLVMVGDGVC